MFARMKHLPLLLSLAISSASAFAQDELPLLPELDLFKPILIEASDVPAGYNLAIQELSLAAIHDDMAEPIPFQIDEYNQGGAVHFEGWGVPISGRPGIFDAEDKLLFLYRDAGPRRQPHHVFDGQVIAEIQLAGADGHTRYVYLMRGSRLRSDDQYVRYSAPHARVETDFYTLTLDKNNHLKWEEFEFEGFVGESPLDTMKIRMNAGLVTALAETQLKNDEFVARPAGERTGPIRTTTQMEVTVWLMNMPMLKVSAQVQHYSMAILYDVRVIMPEVRRRLLVNPTMSLSLDANNLIGATVRTALGPKQPAIVDGKIDDIERQMMESGISIEHNWIWASTKRNLDVLAFFDYLSEANNEPISLYYVDDKDIIDMPERFPGQLPNVGFLIESFPMRGFFGFVNSIHISRGFEGEPEVFTQRIRTSPDITVLTVRD